MRKIHQSNIILLILILLSVKCSNSYAVNYLIGFSAGLDNKVDSVLVQNLTKGISVIVPNGSFLQLNDATSVEDIYSNNNFISIIPNPVISQSVVSFHALQTGNVQMIVCGVDGKVFVNKNQSLQQGQNYFKLRLPSGIFILKVFGSGYAYSKLVISHSENDILPMLAFDGIERTIAYSESLKMKNTGIIPMLYYSTGDKFAFRGYSGSNTTIVFDQPSTSKVIEFKFAETLYAAIQTNTKYSLLNNAFDLFYKTTLKDELKWLNPYKSDYFTLLLLSDSLLLSDGFGFTTEVSGLQSFNHIYSSSSTGYFSASERIQRLIKSHIFRRIKTSGFNSSISDFTTNDTFVNAYNGYSYAVNEYGDMIRYYTNASGIQMIQMLGNADENEWITAMPLKEYANGKVFAINKMLQYSRRNTFPTVLEGYKSQDLLTYIKNMATVNTKVSTFVSYLTYCLTGDGSSEISGILTDRFYTIFMPTNIAMANAVTAGYLPDYTILTSGDAAAKIKATKFILHHFVRGKIFADDGLKYILPNNDTITEELRTSVLKSDQFDNLTLDTTYLSVRKDSEGKLEVSTQAKSGKKFSNVIKTAKVVRGVSSSNFFGTKVVMHEIDDYLVYEYSQGGIPLDNGSAEAVYWELTDQPEIIRLESYRQAGTSIVFKPGELSELNFGGKNNPTITYNVASATWDPKTQYVHADYFTIPLRPQVLQWMELKTPVLKPGVYNVWYCWRRGSSTNNKLKSTFKQEGKEDQALPFMLDPYEYFNTSVTFDVNLANGWKQYNAKAKNSVVCSRNAGTIRVEAAGRHVLRIESLSGGSGFSWWDMIQFIPVDKNQLWPRFDIAGNAIMPATPCELIYPTDQVCVGDLNN